MQIVPKEQLHNALKELYNLIRVTSGFKYEGIAFNTNSSSYYVIYSNELNVSRVCRLIGYYGDIDYHIICRLPTAESAYLQSEHTLNIFNNFINFLKSIPCIKVTPDKYLKYTYYIKLEDL